MDPNSSSGTPAASTNPRSPARRATHAPSLDNAREKLFWFLCGWTGGPNHYIERFGHPRLRARHLPFAIGQTEADQWVACMDQAMAEEGIDPGLRKYLHDAFRHTADWMKNC